MKSRIYICSAMLVLSGCAHLEQAPLVYTSKTSFGLEVSTTSTESPGISMIVGFKQVDAAYVPVAVARKCGSGEKEISELEADLCRERSFHEIKMISGSSNEGGLSSIEQASESEALTNELNQKISSRESAMKDVESQREVLNAKEEALFDLKKRKAEYDINLINIRKLGEDIASVSEADQDKASRNIKQEAEKLKLEVENKNFISSIGGSIDKYSGEEKKREEQIQSAKIALQEADKRHKNTQNEINAVVKKMRMSRMDSYSVFGSFDSKGKATGDSASFQLGKIFATGVASQNISSGLSDMYKNRDDSTQECFKTISGALNGADAESAKIVREALKEMLVICRGQ